MTISRRAPTHLLQIYSFQGAQISDRFEFHWENLGEF